MSAVCLAAPTAFLVLFCRLALTTATEGVECGDQQTCSQLCASSADQSSPRCSCEPGYSLDDDGARCVADPWALPGAILVYNEQKQLKAFNLSTLTDDDEQARRSSSGASVVLHRSVSTFDAFDVDVARQKIYFVIRTDSGSELQSLWLGAAEEVFDSSVEKDVDDEIMNGVGEVHSVAVDWAGGNVYLADVTLSRILACSLRSRRCVVVVDDTNAPLGPVVVDSNNGQLYWNDCSGQGALKTSRLDGRGSRTLLRGVGCVLSLTIDLPLQTIYWVNMFGPGIGYCHLNNCTKVLTLESDMELEYHAVTVFEDDVLCAADSISSDYGHGTVMLLKFNKFRPGYDSARLIKDHLLTQPSSLRVMHGGLQVGGGDVCASLNCSHVCLLSSATTARCVCPAGLELVDARQCVHDWQFESVLFASGNDVLRMSTDYVGGLVDDVIFSAGAGNDVSAMTYDSVAGKLYVGVTSESPSGGYIARVDVQHDDHQQQLTLSREILFSNVMNVTDMHIDDVNIYWITDNKLVVGRKDGAVFKTLVETGDSGMRLTSVAVDSRNRRLLYAACVQSGSSVLACNLSAGNCEPLLNRTRCVRDMVFDADVNTLYWIEENIVMSRHFRDTRERFIQVSPGARAVATSSEHVVWTDDYEAAVYLLSKQTSSSPLRAMRTGRQRLTALTVAAAAAPSTPTPSSCSVNNGGCVELCVPADDAGLTSSDHHRCLCGDRSTALFNTDTCSRPQSLPEAGEAGVTSHVSEGGCQRVQCLNGGSCVMDERQRETCRCPKEFGGSRCELTVIDGTSSSGDVGPAAASDGGQDKSSASSLSSVALHVYVVAALVAVSSMISGDKLKADRSYRKTEESKQNQLKESSFSSSKPFALPRPSLVDSGRSRDKPYVY